MKKAYALILGIILSAILILVPFTGAFADSDPGLSTVVFNSSFSWYTGFPMVDSNGYLDLNDWTITYQSNGIPSSNPSSGDVVYLYQPGDFVEIHFSNWDLLSSYTTPIWCIQFGQNPYYGDGLQNATYKLFQGTNYSESFYKYSRSFTYDNRNINWAHCFFSYPGNNGITSIRIEYDGTPFVWNAIYIKFLGFRNEPNGSYYTQADLMQLEATVANTLSLAQLADIILTDSSDIDLSTLETTTASILQKLANVPDIIQYIDNIESIDINILNAINTFYNYYISLFENYKFTHNSNNNYRFYLYRNNDWTIKDNNSNAYYVISTSEYIFVSQFYYEILSYNDYFIYRIKFPNNNSCTSFNCFYKYSSSPSDDIGYPCYSYYNNYNLYIFIPYIDTSISSWLSFTIQPNDNAIFRFYLSDYDYYVSPYNLSWYKRIELFIRQILGSHNSVPSEVQQTTDQINQNAQAVNNFQSSTQQSLDNDLQNVPVAQYQIQATSGTQYMKAYSEALFNSSNGFRIWYMLPLILFLIGMLIRWGIKK